jgi:two-component system response regulator HydG
MLSTKRVLFVDDDASVCKMFVDLLSHSGYEARTSETGAAALQQIAEFRPNLVLLDISLPDVSGLEVLRKIKSDPSTRGIAVILITGASGLEMKIEGFQTGAYDYVAKTINPRELLLKVDRCFSSLREQETAVALKQKEMLHTIMHTLGHELTAPLATIRNEVRVSQQEEPNADWTERMKRIDLCAQLAEQLLVKLQFSVRSNAKELLPGVHLLNIEKPEPKA